MSFRKPLVLLFAMQFVVTPFVTQRFLSAQPFSESQSIIRSFHFTSDEPPAPGWSRPDQIARVYLNEDLQAFFRRNIEFTEDVPERCTLRWIFTGPRAGFTVELAAHRVKIVERYYDSAGFAEGDAFPEHVVREEYTLLKVIPKTLSVVVDAHLSVHVLVNNAEVLSAPMLFDVTHHQLQFEAGRNEHIVFAGTVSRPESAEAAIHVEPAKRHQNILGFGGSPSIPAYEQLSTEGKEQYWNILQQYNLLIDREYPMGTKLKTDMSNVDDLADATPHYYGDNFPNGEVSNFEYIRRTRALGGTVLYEMWAFPRWAERPYEPKDGKILDAWGMPVKKAAKIDEYTRIIVAFLKRTKERTGSAPEIVGIQNEVEQAPEVFADMTAALRQAMDAAGFSATRIQMADAPFLWMSTQRAKDLQRFPKAWNATDYIASHQYDVQEFLSDPDLYDSRLLALADAGKGKPFLASEICLNDRRFQEPSYRVAFQMAQLYQKDLTVADAEMLLYCWLLLDIEEPSFGSSRSLLVPDRANGNNPIASSFQLRVLGAFSRQVHKGMRRVESASPDGAVLTAAFTDGVHNTLIVLNRSTEARQLNIDWPEAHWLSLETISFYGRSIKAPIEQEISIQPGEILTLSGDALHK